MAERKTKGLLAIALLAVASRMVQIPLGFGSDADAWSMAAAAKNIAASGFTFYEASRLPGYPIPEYLFAAAFRLFGVSFVSANLLACAFGLLAIFGMWKLVERLNLDPLWPTAAFAFHPILWISSAETMDYIFGMCFITWALYFYVRERFLLSGALLGLAAGSRITIAIASVAFLADMVRNKTKFARVAEWMLSFAIVWALSFAPVVCSYGPGFLSYEHTQISYPAALYRLIHEFFGLPILAGLGCLAIAKAVRRTIHDRKKHEKSAFLVAFLFVVLWVPYLAFPLDPFYLVAALPAGILLLAYIWPRRTAWIYALLVALASLVSPLAVDKQIYRTEGKVKIVAADAGAAVSDALWRSALYARAKKMDVSKLPEKAVYVLGDVFFYLNWQLSEPDEWNNRPLVYEHKVFVSTAPKRFFERFKALGWSIYYLDALADYQTKRSFGYSLKELDAQPIKIIYQKTQ